MPPIEVTTNIRKIISNIFFAAIDKKEHIMLEACARAPNYDNHLRHTPVSMRPFSRCKIGQKTAEKVSLNFGLFMPRFMAFCLFFPLSTFFIIVFDCKCLASRQYRLPHTWLSVVSVGG